MVAKHRYSGASAARVWGSIYWENLRGYQDNACMEKRILFRLLSGLHSSIMTQIANQYRFDGEEGGGKGEERRGKRRRGSRLIAFVFVFVFVGSCLAFMFGLTGCSTYCCMYPFSFFLLPK